MFKRHSQNSHIICTYVHTLSVLYYLATYIIMYKVLAFSYNLAQYLIEGT